MSESERFRSRHWVAPGVYDDAGTMHLDIGEMLRFNGWPDTPANRETLARVARETIAKLWPDLPITED